MTNAIASQVTTSIPSVRLRAVAPIFPTGIGMSSYLSNGGAVAHHAEGWFDPVPLLGKRGHKYFPHAGRLASAALAVGREEDATVSLSGDETALFIGTNFGVHQTLRDIESTVDDHGYELLSPLSAPNFSVNIPSSLAGIGAHVTGFNVTVTDPWTAGMSAIALAIRSVSARLVVRAVTGGVDDRSTVSGNGADTKSTDAACLFVLEQDVGAGPAMGHLSAYQGRFSASARARHLSVIASMPGTGEEPAEIAVFAASDDLRRDVADSLQNTTTRPLSVNCDSDSNVFGPVAPLHVLARRIGEARPTTVLSIGPSRSFVALHFQPNSQEGSI